MRCEISSGRNNLPHYLGSEVEQMAEDNFHSDMMGEDGRTNFDLFDHSAIYSRILSITLFNVFWQLTEVNFFFIINIFDIPPGHFIMIARMGLLVLIIAPTIKHFITWMTDTQCRVIGAQCVIYGAIILTEALICIKFEPRILSRMQIQTMILWFLVQVTLNLLKIKILIKIQFYLVVFYDNVRGFMCMVVQF